MKLKDFFKENNKAAIAFSGGVDSAYLLFAAKQSGAEVKAYYVKSVFQPQFELEDALRFAKEWDIELEVICTDVLGKKEIALNPPDRCYYCKKTIFSEIINAARNEGFSLLLDGTNASDDVKDRPGIRALQELQVRSPLRECGLTKQEIRTLSREAGLFTWDKPAYACLATRIMPGTNITEEMLLKTEQAENFLFDLGIRDFRVRMLGDAAKIQVPADQFKKVLEERERIVTELKRYYRCVLLDLEGRG